MVGHYYFLNCFISKGPTAKGGAYGFKIDIIEKANDVKAADNKTTLLMYILEVVEKKLTEPFFKDDD